MYTDIGQVFDWINGTVRQMTGQYLQYTSPPSATTSRECAVWAGAAAACAAQRLPAPACSAIALAPQRKPAPLQATRRLRRAHRCARLPLLFAAPAASRPVISGFNGQQIAFPGAANAGQYVLQYPGRWYLYGRLGTGPTTGSLVVNHYQWRWGTTVIASVNSASRALTGARPAGADWLGLGCVPRTARRPSCSFFISWPPSCS